ncbi:hypothetical protein LC653_30075 [Nostoc sp. CHAB 5784]|uniref:TRADD-N-associated membrane domain-containing protein n=1 Tax=Nostoc mirabile TaxID=2907820 RepID=UPI001E383628|nr:hypothetical protein [Nostoc mirabile]MCC5668008.1 hypothetical protein [Nostoc mirabile CHAB5784]
MKNSSSSSNPEPAHNPYSEIKLSIAKERLRQAHQSFNLAWFTTLLCSMITVGGAVLLLIGTVKEGSITAAAGAISSVCCLKFAKDANDRLDKIPKEWKEES